MDKISEIFKDPVPSCSEVIVPLNENNYIEILENTSQAVLNKVVDMWEELQNSTESMSGSENTSETKSTTEQTGGTNSISIEDFKNNIVRYKFKVLKNNNNFSDSMFCNGIYIGNGIIITAGHCYQDTFNEKEIKIEEVKFVNTNETINNNNNIKFVYYDGRTSNTPWKDISYITIDENSIDSNKHKELPIINNPSKIPLDISESNLSIWVGNQIEKYKKNSIISNLPKDINNFNDYVTVICSTKDIGQPTESGGPVFIFDDNNKGLVGIIGEKHTAYCGNKNTLQIANIAPYVDWIQRESKKNLKVVPYSTESSEQISGETVTGNTSETSVVSGETVTGTTSETSVVSGET